MTSNEFDEFRLTLMNFSVNLVWSMRNKIKLGMEYKDIFFKSYRLMRLIDLMLEYTLQTQADYDVENINFFTVEEMLDIQFRINELLNTDFAHDFILDV